MFSVIKVFLELCNSGEIIMGVLFLLIWLVLYAFWTNGAQRNDDFSLARMITSVLVWFFMVSNPGSPWRQFAGMVLVPYIFWEQMPQYDIRIKLFILAMYVIVY
uniref:Uncharacterized protein n=1 Tax=viral metagenome TaxID=1070528 RepID=A0A6C0EYL8_9ZZZZ